MVLFSRMKKLIIIKLGGSIVTNKNSATPKAKIDVIKQLAQDIAEIRKNYRLILVHGAGSYAHPLVKKSGIHKGIYSDADKLAFAQENIDMLTLNNLITHSLVDQSIPCTSLPPHSFISKKNDQLTFDTKLIKKYLVLGLVPVLYGDMILDNTQNASVLSGDAITTFLARELKPDKVIFLSDVDGIFDSDPKKNPQAKLIPEINNDNLENILTGLTDNNPHDVTGEMKGKILEIKSRLSGTEVILANGLKPQILKKVLDQSPVGTELLFE